jgi:predicted HNH restriction endonuclease
MAWTKPKGKYPGNWDKIKSLVIDSANYRCEICKIIPDNFKKNYKPYASDNFTTAQFRVHHKDLDKSNNNLPNLIYVCKGCHGELHRELNRKDT